MLHGWLEHILMYSSQVHWSTDMWRNNAGERDHACDNGRIGAVEHGLMYSNQMIRDIRV